MLFKATLTECSYPTLCGEMIKVLWSSGVDHIDHAERVCNVSDY